MPRYVITCMTDTIESNHPLAIVECDELTNVWDILVKNPEFIQHIEVEMGWDENLDIEAELDNIRMEQSTQDGWMWFEAETTLIEGTIK